MKIINVMVLQILYVNKVGYFFLKNIFLKQRFNIIKNVLFKNLKY